MVFNTFTKIILTPIYYIIHHNYLFGFIHKFFIKNFYYNNLTFELKVKDIPLQNYASFLFKTYEYNDRKLIENHISKKNRAIILGGGLGFIPTLTYKKSKNKILVFEINKEILSNLEKNLTYNKTARNFNPIMSMAAKNTLVQAKEIVQPNFTNPEHVITPGIFVQKIIEVKEPIIETIAIEEGLTYP